MSSNHLGPLDINKISKYFGKGVGEVGTLENERTARGTEGPKRISIWAPEALVTIYHGLGIFST
jgi:hypothetical protein